MAMGRPLAVLGLTLGQDRQRIQSSFLVNKAGPTGGPTQRGVESRSTRLKRKDIIKNH